MMRSYRRIALVAISVILVFVFLNSCTWVQEYQRLRNTGTDEFLSSDEFTLVCWNLGKRAEVAADLRELAADNDVVCVQEFVPSLAPEGKYCVDFGASFKQFFVMETNGVATISHVCPETVQARSSWWKEGLVLTPKMMLFTVFQIAEERLLIVNLHGLNFQPVFKYMLSEQLQQVADAIAAHVGPVVVCGDFNTWRNDRLELAKQKLHGLSLVQFPPGRRTADWVATLACGSTELALDHIFIRGLSVIGAPEVLSANGATSDETASARGSDHAALRVRLQLNSDNARIDSTDANDH